MVSCWLHTRRETYLVLKSSYFLSLSHDFTGLTSEFWILDFGNSLSAMQMKKPIIMEEEEGTVVHFLLLRYLLVLYLASVKSIQSMSIFIWVWQEVLQHQCRRCGLSDKIHKILFCYHFWFHTCETRYEIWVGKCNSYSEPLNVRILFSYSAFHH